MYNFQIQCVSSDCGEVTEAGDIINLIYECLDETNVWILCGTCGERGFITKWVSDGRRRELENHSEHLKAIIKLDRFPPDADGSQNRKFVFLLSYRKDEPPSHIWPCFYWKGGDETWRVRTGVKLSLSEVGHMMDYLERPDGQWGLGITVPRHPWPERE